MGPPSVVCVTPFSNYQFPTNLSDIDRPLNFSHQVCAGLNEYHDFSIGSLPADSFSPTPSSKSSRSYLELQESVRVVL